jgi:membrane protein
MGVFLKLTGLSWLELFRAIWRGAVETNIANRAAELAFWFLLGFFPMLLAVTGIVAMIGSAPGSQGTLMSYVGEVLPSGASSLVRQVLAQTTGGGKAWFSLIFALWSSSSATSGLIDTLNAIYDREESRPWWKSRLLALALAVATGMLLTAALIIVVYGPVILDKVAPGSSALYVWKIAQWPVAALLLIVALLGIYRFAPDLKEQKWNWLMPGSIVAAVTWMAVSMLFKVYVRHFSHFGLLYGSLGTLIILMLWFYLSGAAILVGGVINAVLEDAAAGRRFPGANRRGHGLPTKTHLQAPEPQSPRRF